MAATKSKQQILTACVLDTETGGLDAKTCAITQLSCQVVRLDNFEILGVFDEYIKPYQKNDFALEGVRTLRKKKEIEQEEQSYFLYTEDAMKTTGLTFEYLMKHGKDINEVASSFIAFMKKFSDEAGKGYKPILVGQNIQFDLNFLMHLFIYTKKIKEFSTIFSGTEDFFGNFQATTVDTLTLSKMIYANDPSVGTCKLQAMADRLGIELVDAHSSMADVEATNGLLTIYTNRMRCTEGNETDMIKQPEKTRTHFKI